ncbi:unnamed protein product [Pylaiella littoralis]
MAVRQIQSGGTSFRIGVSRFVTSGNAESRCLTIARRIKAAESRSREVVTESLRNLSETASADLSRGSQKDSVIRARTRSMSRGLSIAIPTWPALQAMYIFVLENVDLVIQSKLLDCDDNTELTTTTRNRIGAN